MNPYIANTSEDVERMLKRIGVKSIDDLFADIQPQQRPQSFNLPEGLSEYEAVRKLTGLASANASDLTLFIGGGFYDHYVPAAVFCFDFSRRILHRVYTVPTRMFAGHVAGDV